VNYEKIYDSLIEKAKARHKPIGYAEKHHIVPVSLGGNNDASNLVYITAREHFLCHFLLAKIHGGSQWYAVMIFKAGDNRVLNSKLYEIAKIKHAIWMSENFKGKPLNPEHKSKISFSLKGNTRTLGRSLSEEHRLKISKSLIGNTRTLGMKVSESTKQKMSESRSGEKHHYYGKSRSDSVKFKISESLKGRKNGPWSEEVKNKIRAGVLAANARKVINPNP